MARRSIHHDDVLAQVLDSGEESLQGDDYGNISDFQSEFSGSETEEQVEVSQVSNNNIEPDVDGPNPEDSIGGTAAPQNRHSTRSPTSPFFAQLFSRPPFC